MQDVSGLTAPTDVQALELPVAVIGMVIGFGLAAVGGVLGRQVRRSLLATPR
jgi:hypothetical protein